jgi:hypothetical protein
MTTVANPISPALLERALVLVSMGSNVLPVGFNKKPLRGEWKCLQSITASAARILTRNRHSSIRLIKAVTRVISSSGQCGVFHA